MRRLRRFVLQQLHYDIPRAASKSLIRIICKAGRVECNEGYVFGLHCPRSFGMQQRLFDSKEGLSMSTSNPGYIGVGRIPFPLHVRCRKDSTNILRTIYGIICCQDKRKLKCLNCDNNRVSIRQCTTAQTNIRFGGQALKSFYLRQTGHLSWLTRKFSKFNCHKCPSSHK